MGSALAVVPVLMGESMGPRLVHTSSVISSKQLELMSGLAKVAEACGDQTMTETSSQGLVPGRAQHIKSFPGWLIVVVCGVLVRRVLRENRILFRACELLGVVNLRDEYGGHAFKRAT
jgi:hypothetical protein